MISSTPPWFDVAIVGGGLTGSSLALSLARLRNAAGEAPRILLLEARAFGHAPHPAFDGRALALAQGTQQALAALDLWAAFAPHAAAIRSVHVSDRGHYGRVLLTADELGLPALGQVIPLHDTGCRLQERLLATPGIDYLTPATVVALTQQPDRVSLQLADGSRFDSRLLVLADGGLSSGRELLQLPWQEQHLGQSAVIANVQLKGAEPGRAWERFTESGPIALLPLGGLRWSLVWTMRDDEAAGALAWSDAEFLKRLQRAFGYRAGRFVQVGRRDRYPLLIRQSSQRIGARLALVGNAAQQLHPVAGQGFNLGLRDVLTLTRLLESAWQKQEDPGAESLLQAYQAWREPDVTRTLWWTSSLARLFASDAWPLVCGRTMGLHWLNRLPGFKQHLARYALGQAADLPR